MRRIGKPLLVLALVWAAVLIVFSLLIHLAVIAVLIAAIAIFGTSWQLRHSAKRRERRDD